MAAPHALRRCILCFIICILFLCLLFYLTNEKIPRMLFPRPSQKNKPNDKCPKCPQIETQVPCSVCPKCPQLQTKALCSVCPKCPKIKTQAVKKHLILEDKAEISRKLLDIHQALKFSLSHKSSPLPGVLLDLEGIIEQLDPAYALSKTMEKVKVEVNTSVVLDVCPEEYRGEKYGYPYYHTGWVITNCTNARPLPELITILLNTVDYPEKDEKQVDVVLKGINNTYPGVRTFLAPKNKHIQASASRYEFVTVVNISSESNSCGSVWNKLASMVNTTYTLVARDIVHFDFTARLERQIHMISDTDYVGVVGGSFRNLTGHWRVGCRQTRMMNYVLKFQEGYHHSRKSCMFCDDLEGPFVAKTELIKSIKFSEKFSNEIIFEDLFLRIIRSGSLVMNCPDVMYYTTGNSSEVKKTSRQVWHTFARDWILVRILLPGTRHSFSCKDISFICEAHGVTKDSALPKCCLEQWGGAMRFLQEFCTKNDVRIELDCGSNLAAVKFNNYSPFDIDGDIILSPWNYSFVKKYIPYFKKNGYPITRFADATFDSNGKVINSGYLNVLSPDIVTEAYGFKMSAVKYLPPELRHLKYFTKVLVDGHWINAAFSPGLMARNRYGPDVLKHSQSWIKHGKKSSWERYEPGRFMKCTKPGFHSCLDRFPADGNIAFKVDDEN